MGITCGSGYIPLFHTHGRSYRKRQDGIECDSQFHLHVWHFAGQWLTNGSSNGRLWLSRIAPTVIIFPKRSLHNNVFLPMKPMPAATARCFIDKMPWAVSVFSSQEPDMSHGMGTVNPPNSCSISFATRNRRSSTIVTM